MESCNPIRVCRRRSGFGAHQFQLPMSAISAGTSSALTMLASTATASAAPRPSCFGEEQRQMLSSAPIATQNSSAAAVTMRPVRSIPSAIASRLGRPSSCASLMRASTNTS